MEIPLLSGIVSETRSHPYTMIALLALLAGMPYTWRNSARASDVVSIQAQLTSISRQNLEQQLAAIESELFTLNQQVNDKNAGHKPIDAVYYTRINQLNIDKARLERALSAMH